MSLRVNAPQGLPSHRMFAIALAQCEWCFRVRSHWKIENANVSAMSQIKFQWRFLNHNRSMWWRFRVRPYWDIPNTNINAMWQALKFQKVVQQQWQLKSKKYSFLGQCKSRTPRRKFSFTLTATQCEQYIEYPKARLKRLRFHLRCCLVWMHPSVVFVCRRCPVRCLNNEAADDSATTSFNRSGADLTFSAGVRRDKPPKPRGSYRFYVSHKDLEPNNSAKARKKPSYIVNYL